ncbi:AbrB family transcriptional regulator [Microvirga sp. P5_D2]
MSKSIKVWVKSFYPARFPYKRFLVALLIGALGAVIFVRLGLPLPWMLGSMVACTLASLMRAPVAAPACVRPPMTMIIGVMLGTGFTPQIFENVGNWIPTTIGLTVFILVSGSACFAYFRYVAGFDRPTAYFSGMPGGLMEMVIAGEDKGGDARTIALVHSARILLVVLTLPFLVRLISGTSLGSRLQFGLSIFETPWRDELWLLATAVAGALLGHILCLPARLLLGPMLFSATVHALGWTRFAPAIEIVNVAQLVLGTTIGCRFVTTAPREIVRILILSTGSTVILLGCTGIFAAGVSHMSSYDQVPLLLAYSPGGLAEMSLIALSLGIEVAFVAAHHVIRVFIVMIGATPAFAVFERLK